jgi:cysteine-rich protein 2-binding protein
VSLLAIDISESLVYPEHTIVVTIRKLVVGCGFIAPNGYITYICLHPEWQKSGLGSFMLYHLIQTCPGKDITLHVSATNPAMLLYQKFCFKVEEFIKNFYDKYLPDDSPQCKHAYFLRLRH